MKRLPLFVCLFSSIAASTASANDLYLDLSNDSFRARFDATHATNGIIYSGEALISDDNGELFSFGLQTHGTIGNNGNLEGGVGGKLYGVNTDGENYSAFALGANISYSFSEVPGLSITSSLHYAPSITVSNDFDSFSQLNVDIGYALFENGEIYGGLRRIQADHSNNTTHEFDDGLHAGIKITF